MRIAFVVPGFGGTFYCQNCMRDSHMIDRLRAIGHEVVIAPMYLPVRIDEPLTQADTPVFYGAINAYLKEMIPLFRRSPEWLERLLNSKGLLKWAAKRSGSTNVRGLGKLTLSVLQGKEGTQSRELDRLVDWLKNKCRPDVVHLSNALLIGLARQIKEELGIPLFCTLQDEDTWIDAMGDEYGPMGWKVLSERVSDIDAFIAVSSYYAQVMKEKMKIPDKKIHVVHIGINIPACKPGSRPFDPPVIGYLSRMSSSLGLDILVDAFIQLKKEDKLKGLKLRATGGCLGEDKKFISKLKKQLKRYNFHDDAQFIPDYYKDNQCEFLQSLTLLSVPVSHGEAFGTYLIEALSVGVPVVQPEAGAFPEVVKDTGGGITYKPNTSDKLAEALRSLLLDPEKTDKLGRQGRDSVLKRYSIGYMVKNLDKIYKKYI